MSALAIGETPRCRKCWRITSQYHDATGEPVQGTGVCLRCAVMTVSPYPATLSPTPVPDAP